MKDKFYVPINKDKLRDIYTLEEPHEVSIKPASKRTLAQNDKLHPLLRDVSRQVKYAGKYRSVEDWKDIFAAAIRMVERNEEVVPGIEGGVVVLGLHTSDMSVSQVQKMIDYIYAWSVDQDINWTEDRVNER